MSKNTHTSKVSSNGKMNLQCKIHNKDKSSDCHALASYKNKEQGNACRKKRFFGVFFSRKSSAYFHNVDRPNVCKGCEDEITCAKLQACVLSLISHWPSRMNALITGFIALHVCPRFFAAMCMT